MTTHPTADELLRAVAGFIGRIAPELKDRDVFLARVAVNALNVVRRELAEGPAAEAVAAERTARLLQRTGDAEALNAALCKAIRAGALEGEALLDHLERAAIDQVRIDQPHYSGLKTTLRDG